MVNHGNISFSSPMTLVTSPCLLERWPYMCISFEAITVMHLTSNSLSHTMSARRKRYIIDGDITGRCWTPLSFEDYCKCSRLLGELTEIVGSTEPAITSVSRSLPHLQVEGRPDGQCRPEPNCRLS